MNPFKAPSISEILRNAEERVKETPKKPEGLKIWEKTTAASRPHTTKRTKRSPRTQPSLLPSKGDGEKQETAAEFVAKKRDIFWIQMNINLKKAEISKLDELKAKRESAISAARKKMDEDKARLNAYYSVNDAKSAESLKRLKEQRSENSNLTEETKSLRAKLAAMETRLTELEGNRADSLALKNFLDSLNSGRQFKDGKEMMEVFANLEEQNLQIIDEIQMREEQIEEQQISLTSAKEKTETGLSAMETANTATRNEILKIKEASSKLEIAIQTSRNQESMAAVLRELQGQVLNVHEICGLDGQNAGQDIIQMLTNIERVADTVLKKLAKADAVMPGFAVKLEKVKEKERRTKLRAGRVAAEKKKSEERSKKSLERAMRPVAKKSGKPVMFRSALVKEEVVDAPTEDNEGERLSKIFGFYFDADKLLMNKN